MNTLRVRNIYSMILVYELDGKLNEDMILAGFLSNSLFYEKSDKEEVMRGDK